jgi:S-adenosylmethionine:tRNA ribosyltransferase-isomerase
LVGDRKGITHHTFKELGSALQPGDLLVVNTSATIPAAVDGFRRDGSEATVHLSHRDDDGRWVLEVRTAHGREPFLEAEEGEKVRLAGGACVVLHEPANTRAEGGVRLWKANLISDAPIELYLSRHGRPISYSYVSGDWPLSAYQTIFARKPGSAEMPSAGRPFTHRLLTELVTEGVVVAPILLHTGVSSLEAGEPPQPERYRVPVSTAALVQLTRRNGGRVIAIGTTVTRALESVAREDGSVSAGEGWTDLVLGSQRPARTVDGIVTGWHAPEASHLDLLESVVGPALVRTAYAAALEENYLWHEFGDSCLLFR